MAKTSTKKISSNHKASKPAAKPAIKSSMKSPVKAAKPAKTAPAKSDGGVKVGSSKVEAKYAPRIEPRSESKKLKNGSRAEKSMGVIPAAAVPTDGKPRKNQAGLNSRELEHFRDLLLDKRRELLGDVRSMESEALRSSGGTNLSNLPIHMADMGTDNYEQEFTLSLVEKDRNLLRDINAALGKIQNGTYGICEGSGKPITKVRLEAQPWAKYSIEYARRMEKGIR